MAHYSHSAGSKQIKTKPLRVQRQCRGCGTLDNPGQWWQLSNYYGVTGTFCSDCYDQVSHDSYEQPRRPDDYVLMLLKLSGK
jgi:hypothetical protein